MASFFKKQSLTKQILFIISVILVIVLISFTVTDRIAKNIIEEKASDSAEKILLQVEDKITSFYNDMNGISIALIYSPTVKTYINDEDILDRILMNSDISSVFANTNSLKENIQGIQLFNKQGNMIANAGLGSGDITLKNPVRTIEYSGMLNLSDGDRFKTYYSISIPIYNLKNDKNIEDYVGACVFVMDTNNFSKILKNSLISENSKLLLLDKDNKILAGEGKFSKDTFNIDKWQNDRNYIVQTIDLSSSGWKLISVIPRNDLIQDMNIIKSFNLAVYIVMIGVLCLFLFIFFIQILKPVDELIYFMKTYPEKGGKRRFKVKQNNEIGVLGINLNKMLDDIDALSSEIQSTQKKIYEIELANKQMEITSYKNQINPHFLYNTLECIRGIALYHRVQEIADISTSLSSIFRYSIKGNDFVTVEEELSHVKEYAKIIEFRFMKRIQVDINVNEDILNIRMVKMLIQPIVENAVFHGLEKKIDQGIVFIEGKKDGQDILQFTIRDNGYGMEEEQLNKLLELLKDDKHQGGPENEKGYGIGISNIYKRIKLYYGDKAEMNIQSKLHFGTTVIIRIPIN